MYQLTIDQCKKLKKIGFPQYTYFWWNQNRNRFEGYDYYLASGQSGDQGDHVACPTLEELIEWLGDDFNQLRWHPSDYHQKGGFMAYNRTENSEVYREGFGTTPLEAVYNLAINLHQAPSQFETPLT